MVFLPCLRGRRIGDLGQAARPIWLRNGLLGQGPAGSGPVASPVF